MSRSDKFNMCQKSSSRLHRMSIFAFKEKLNVQLVEAEVNREEILKGLEKYEQYQENDHRYFSSYELQLL